MNAYDKIFVIDDNFDPDAFMKKPATKATFQELAKGEMLPPMLPDLFDYEVTKKHITNGGDLEVIMKTYRKNFACFTSLPVLNFSYAGNWTVKETKQLSLLWPCFTHVEYLLMHDCGLDDKAVNILGNNMENMKNWDEKSKLKMWVLSKNPQISEEMKFLVRGALPEDCELVFDLTDKEFKKGLEDFNSRLWKGESLDGVGGEEDE